MRKLSLRVFLIFRQVLITSTLSCFLLLAAHLIFARAAGWQAANDYAGSAACAACHKDIYQSYTVTPMARSSGRVGQDDFRENLNASQFRHEESEANYRISKDRDGLWLLFDRESPEGDVRGRRRLDYFIGSGAAARSYLFLQDGFLFQSPVTYYSARGKWAMSPGYERSTTINLARPIETECLQCHASRLQPIKGTQNGYDGAPFLENGVSCERCHGPGRNHIAKMVAGQLQGAREIINPARLAPPRRDSVCAQCHLTGEERIIKAGHSLADFKPGDLLSDHAVSFVLSPAPRGLTVTSHYEKFAQSRCKQVSGDRLWCGSCHNAHSVPAPAERAAYFRQKCLACHQQTDCKTEMRLRERQRDDCAACHMPRQPTLDVGHVVYTDHSIPRWAIPRWTIPRLPDKPSNLAINLAELNLIPFGQAGATPRDTGLAYAKAGVRLRHQPYLDRAFGLLKGVERELQQDAEALMQFGYLHDRAGEEDKAANLYQRALSLDPALLEAAVNLGAILAQRGHAAEAIKLWEDALMRNPGFETASLNLAGAHLRNHRPEAAESVLLKALAYNPDLPLTRKLLAESRRGRERK
jgi:hypothetical protein